MKISITANLELHETLGYARRVLKFLEREGVEVVLEEQLAKKLKMKPSKKADCDVLVTIGGDGTVLRSLQTSKAKILSINAGSVGFLTEVMPDDIETRLADLLDGKYFLDKRTKLKVAANGRRLLDCTNEAVVHTATISKMRHFMLWVDGEMALDVRADGIIIATPTGSTCYAMSAGGPIIDPSVNAFVIAPLAAYKMFVRPIVVPASSLIEVRFGKKRDCLLVLDGQYEERLDASSVLKFSQSEEEAHFVRFKEGFYERLREKFKM